MKLKALILEGMYDKITGQVNKKIFKVVKDAMKGSGTEEDPKQYKGYDVRKEPMNGTLGDFFELDRRELYVGDFQDDTSGLDFEVTLKFALSKRGVKPGKFYINGGAETDEEFPSIGVEIGINPMDGEKILSKIQPVLRDLIRHEIEHLTHGRNSLGSKYSKWMRGDKAMRQKIRSNSKIYYKYYLLPKEVDANIHGLYAKAKTLKQPYQKVVDDYLDSLVKDGTIEPKHRQMIYNKWKKRIPKIGGLPKLK